MKLLEMGNDMKIKHSVSSLSYNVWGNFFRKKALHEGTSVCGEIYGEMFYIGANDQIMQRGRGGRGGGR